MQSIRSKPIPKAVLAFLGVLGIILICCWGLNYWWFDIAAYIRLDRIPKLYTLLLHATTIATQALRPLTIF
jgi:hypothetical protein